MTEPDPDGTIVGPTTWRAWTLRSAGKTCAQLQPMLQAEGWILGLYGSTLYAGMGRDLDLLLCPWRPVADGYAEPIRQVFAWHGWTCVAESPGSYGKLSMNFVEREVATHQWFRYIDLQVRPLDLREPEHLYPKPSSWLP